MDLAGYGNVSLFHLHISTHHSPKTLGTSPANQLSLFRYPVVTQTVYLIASPWFNDINITVNGNSTLRITANNLDNANSYYVQSVKINGEDWNKNWFEHEDVMVTGGTIHFEMGSEMKFWETGDVPPSPGHFTKPRPG